MPSVNTHQSLKECLMMETSHTALTFSCIRLKKDSSDLMMTKKHLTCSKITPRRPTTQLANEDERDQMQSCFFSKTWRMMCLLASRNEASTRADPNINQLILYKSFCGHMNQEKRLWKLRNWLDWKERGKPKNEESSSSSDAASEG